jgi:hypothetical protein
MVVTAVAVVVVQKREIPAEVVAEAPPVAPPPSPVIEARQTPVVKANKVRPPPPPPAVETVEEPDDRESKRVDRRKSPKTPKPEAPPPDKPGNDSAAPTFKEVHAMIKQLQLVDEAEGEKMMVTLLEVGRNDQQRLTELHRKVKATLDAKK